MIGDWHMSRKRPGTDTPAYYEMLGRLVRTAGRRAGEDTAALAELAAVQAAVDAAMVAAVARLHRHGGLSWDEIAAALGKPRQNVWRKYAGGVATSCAECCGPTTVYGVCPACDPHLLGPVDADAPTGQRDTA